MIVNKQHHEFLIAYYRDRYMKLPHGKPEMHRGKPVIAVNYDPNNPSVTSRRTERFVLTTENGQLYQKLTEEAGRIKLKLDELLFEWKITYRNEPRDIKYPLRRSTNSGLNREFYINSKPNQNPREFDHEITYKGQRLRSKNELIVCQALDRIGYEYKTEILINTYDMYSFAPDVTFYIKELEKPVAMEIDGAMDKPGYFDKSSDRKKYYVKSGFKEFKDIVFFRLNESQSFDYGRLEAVIKASILANMEDIIH